jgi:hypothetical protein
MIAVWLIAHAIPGSEAGEIEGWVDPGLTVADADALGQQVAPQIAQQLPDMRSFTWTRAAPG